MFSAALRMAAHIPRKVRIAFVEEVCFCLYNCLTMPHVLPMLATASATACGPYMSSIAFACHLAILAIVCPEQHSSGTSVAPQYHGLLLKCAW